MNIELHSNLYSSSFELWVRDERGAGRRVGFEVGVVCVGSHEPDFAIFEIGQELGVLFGMRCLLDTLRSVRLVLFIGAIHLRELRAYGVLVPGRTPRVQWAVHAAT